MQRFDLETTAITALKSNTTPLEMLSQRGRWILDCSYSTNTLESEQDEDKNLAEMFRELVELPLLV